MSKNQSDKGLPVLINTTRCKGCNICVYYCPTQVLKLIKAQSTVVNPEACTFCRLCELRCPDFAVTVDLSKKKKDK